MLIWETIEIDLAEIFKKNGVEKQFSQSYLLSLLENHKQAEQDKLLHLKFGDDPRKYYENSLNRLTFQWCDFIYLLLKEQLLELRVEFSTIIKIIWKFVRM